MGKKKAAVGFLVFLGLMWLCTLLSKSVYAAKLPLVETEKLQEKYIPHEIEVQGIVIEGGILAVTALPGLRIETFAVRAGDRVAEGDLLFQADLEDLQKLIENKKKEMEKLTLKISTIEQNQELAKQKKALEEERARADYDTISRLKNTDLGRAEDSYARALQELEDFQNNPDDWGMNEEERAQQEQVLRDAVQQAAYGEADAMRERDDAIESAQRNVEDILFPENAQDTLALLQLELISLQQETAPYEQLLQAEGKVFSQKEGMVTQLLAEPGGRTTDTAVVNLTDDTLPCQFKAAFDREQKSYVVHGDLATIRLEDGRQLEAELPYFTESQGMEGGAAALIELPENIGTPGLSGKLSVTKQGEKYKSCISLSALHKADYKTYVYVLKQREGILGNEYYVEEVVVKLLDENESWAAIESAFLDGESRIITFADKEIKKGDVVRPVE